MTQLRVATLSPAEGRYRYESFAKIRHIRVFLDPNGDGESARDVLPLEIFSKITAQQLAAFKLGAPYGPDPSSKMMKVCEEFAR